MIGYSPNSLVDFPLTYYGQDNVRLWRKPKQKNGEEQKPGGTTAAGSFWTIKSTGLKPKKVTSHPEFTQSVAISGTGSNQDELEDSTSAFIQSVMVVPGSSSRDGSYTIYPAAHNVAVSNSTRSMHKEEKEFDFTASLVQSSHFEHNINHPGRKQVMGIVASADKRHSLNMSLGKKDLMSEYTSSSSHQDSESQTCDCGKYHRHVFEGVSLDSSRFQKSLEKSSSAEIVRKNPPSELVHANNSHNSICNIFWKPSLSFCPYQHGDARVSFTTLWPSTNAIKSLLREGLEEVGLDSALWELCVYCMVGAPVSLLKCLLDYKYITPDYQPDNDASLLHLACVLGNQEAVQLLTGSQYNASRKVKDKTGMMPADVCFSNKMLKLLPSKLHDHRRPQMPLKMGAMDRDAIFRNVSHPKHFYELMKKLHMFKFDVNNERNKEGNSILHVAASSGICQLPLLLAISSLHKTTFDTYNNAGLTPLMIAVQQGDQTLCEAMVCLFGANPNQQNKQNGKTALHYAAEENHIGIVDILIKRGADVNVEDEEHCRPDDLCSVSMETSECVERIQLEREQRQQLLQERILNDTLTEQHLRATDHGVVDKDEFTLVMYAATHNTSKSLEALLKHSTMSINAQHPKTGQTALGMAAKAGHHEVCGLLLRYGASVRVKDMQGFLPLHLAVLQNHELVVYEFTDPANFIEDKENSNRPQDAFVGLHAALRLCRKSSIHERLTACWEKRQEEIVNPLLRLCAMKGDSERLYNILEEGDNLNSRDNLNNQPALFVAIEHNNLDVIQLLVERGSDIRRRDTTTGDSVLHLVAKAGNLHIAEYFLSLNKSGKSTGSHDLKHDLQPCLDINAMNCEKKTPLHIAAEKGFVRFVNVLISYGASTSLLEADGRLFTCAQFEGVRIQIERTQRQHTRLIMQLVADKNKKMFLELMKRWVPKLDHNLRDATGDTPLMVASFKGLLSVVNFLLQSAVYADTVEAYDCSDNGSDTDSGVPDLPPQPTHRDAINEVLERSGDDLPLGASCDQLAPTARPGTVYDTSYKPDEVSQMGAFLSQTSRPKGLSIYHDGLVSHVCAVNPHTGNTALHQCLAGGDYSDVAMALVGADIAVLNMQNNKGLTAVHLGCKLKRKKCLQKLLMVTGVDLNLYTLAGQLPEDLSSSNRIIKMVQQARKGHPIRPSQAHSQMTEGTRTSGVTQSVRSAAQSDTGSTINFDKIYEQYESLKQSQAPSYISNLLHRK